MKNRTVMGITIFCCIFSLVACSGGGSPVATTHPAITKASSAASETLQQVFTPTRTHYPTAVPPEIPTITNTPTGLIDDTDFLVDPPIETGVNEKLLFFIQIFQDGKALTVKGAQKDYDKWFPTVDMHPGIVHLANRPFVFRLVGPYYVNVHFGLTDRYFSSFPTAPQGGVRLDRPCPNAFCPEGQYPIDAEITYINDYKYNYFWGCRDINFERWAGKSRPSAIPGAPYGWHRCFDIASIYGVRGLMERDIHSFTVDSNGKMDQLSISDLGQKGISTIYLTVLDADPKKSEIGSYFLLFLKMVFDAQ